MIKRETKYIIRRILIGVGIALILGFIKTCEVKAETITSVWNAAMYLNVNGTNQTSYVWTGTKPFQGSGYTGEATIVFNFTYYVEVASSGAKPHTMKEMAITTSSGTYICTYTTSVVDGANDQVQGTATCPVNITSANGVYNLRILLNGTDNRSEGFLASYYATLITNNDAAFMEKLNYLTNLYTMTNQLNYLSTIIDAGNNTQYTQLNAINATIYNLAQSMNTNWTAQYNQLETLKTKIDSLVTSITAKQEETTQAINDMNDTLKSENVDSPNNSISQMEQNLPTNSVISDLLTLPIRMFQNILNAVNGSCSAFSLGTLFGTNLVLPCINIENYLGSALWGAIDVIFCGIFILSIRKKFVEIFENITSLKNGGNELE